MNRPTVGPQSLRGLPNGFTNQQQIPQNRSVSSRLPPSGKMAGNTSTWAFGGVPMGSAGLNRQENRQMSTFAQAMNSSQQATQLDLSEFPSLSNHPGQQSLTSNQSTWTAGARGLPAGRLQHSNLSAAQQLNAQAQTQQQQDDLFNSSSQLPSSQSGFRFGAQNAVGQSSQPQSNTNTADEFPPLGRNGVGELGQDRASSLLQNVGFGNPPNGLGFGSNNQTQPNRSNGLLNALSSTSRATSGNRVASPASISGVSNSRSPTDANPNRQGLSGVPENDSGGFTNTQFATNPMTNREEGITQPNLPSSSRQDNVSQQAESSHPRSQTIDSGIGSSQGNPEVASPGFEDPLVGMSDIDKWGLKGLTYMMQNYPDYAALVTGHNVGDLGFDLDSPEPFSTQIYSLFDSEPPRPDIPLFTNPECYKVHNVATLDSKVSAFNDESLLFMFYSNPGDVQQVMAAGELHNRNWRFHKKLQLWLTKDLEMCPQQISNDTERGYYIFFDTKSWQRERREFILKYSDLEAVPPTGQS